MSWLTDRLQTTAGRRPYPVADLASALGIDPTNTSALALRLGLNRGWVLRCRHLGLTDQQADHWATRAGLHPLDIWPQWGQTELSARDWDAYEQAIETAEAAEQEPA